MLVPISVPVCALRRACYAIAAQLWLRAQNMRAQDMRAPDVRARTRGDRGYTTEVVIGTVALAGLALTALSILGPKIIAKMNAIDLGR